MNSIALFALAVGVAAAEPPSPRSSTTADEHYREADRLLDLGDYVKAIIELERSEYCLAKARLGLMIGGDDLHQLQSRFMGINQSDPERAERLVAAVLPEIARLAEAEPDAMHVLGRLYFAGVGVPEDQKKGVDLLKAAAAKGFILSEVVLSNLYASGVGVEKDAERGTEMLLKIADANKSVTALAFAGVAYRDGIGVKKNLDKARLYFDQAIQQGSIDAMEELVELEMSNLKAPGLTEDLSNSEDIAKVVASMKRTEALKVRAALAGRLMPKLYLADFERSSGLLGNESRGYVWIDSASESGLPGPLLLKCCCLYEGWGCTRDEDEADRLLEVALEAAKKYELDEFIPKIEATKKRITPAGRGETLAEQMGWKKVEPMFLGGLDGQSGLNMPPLDAERDMPAERPKAAATEKPNRAAQPVAKLRVIDSAWQVTPSGNYVKVFGRVKNVSNEEIDGIWVDVMFEAARGQLVAKGSGPVQPNPLRPGEVGTFEVMEKTSPAIAKYNLKFRKLLGESIPAAGR